MPRRRTRLQTGRSLGPVVSMELRRGVTVLRNGVALGQTKPMRRLPLVPLPVLVIVLL